jgi:hypothetical protein
VVEADGGFISDAVKFRFAQPHVKSSFDSGKSDVDGSDKSEGTAVAFGIQHLFPIRISLNNDPG